MDSGQNDDKARANSRGSGGDVSAPRTTRIRKQLSLETNRAERPTTTGQSILS